MKYVTVLEIIVLLLAVLLLVDFFEDHYKCTVDYSLIGVNISVDVNGTKVLYDKDETLFVLKKNRGLPYNANVSCNLYFGE
jgi:hypothetical protein